MNKKKIAKKSVYVYVCVLCTRLRNPFLFISRQLLLLFLFMPSVWAKEKMTWTINKYLPTQSQTDNNIWWNVSICKRLCWKKKNSPSIHTAHKHISNTACVCVCGDGFQKSSNRHEFLFTSFFLFCD